MNTVRGITLSEGEQVIRQYEASSLKVPKADGYVIATNRRMIFTGSAETALGSSVIVRDTKIDSISGVIGGLTHKKSLTQIIIGSILGLYGLINLIDDVTMLYTAIFLVGIALVISGLRAGGVQMYLSIFSSEASPAISVSVQKKRGLFSKIGSNDAVMTVGAAGPGKHTEQMIREIGALIQDIQVMGDLAIEKWATKPIQENATDYEGNTDYLANTMQTITKTVNAVKEANAKPVTSEKTFTAPPVQKDEATIVPLEKVESATCECGAINDVGSRFCESCGSSLQNQEKTNIFA